MHIHALIRQLMTTVSLLVVVASVTLGTAASAAAQAATPAATPEATPTVGLARAMAFPVSIHQGTCQDFVAQPVGPAIDAGVAGHDVDDPGAELIGINAQLPVLEASADYDGTLAYFTDTPHVVVIHASSEEFGTAVACGQIAGFVDDDGELVFAIRGDGSDSVSGVAIFKENETVVDQELDLIDQEADFGDDSIHVTVYIVSGGSDEIEGG